MFKVRIFPIEPNSKKRITLSYTQVLKADAGLVSYVYPLNTEKFSAKPIKNVSIKVELESKRPLKSIYSPSHAVEIKRHGANRATVGFEATDVQAGHGLRALFRAGKGRTGRESARAQDRRRRRLFPAARLAGHRTRRTRSIVPKDVAFVLDTSGSMAGKKLEQAKKALQFCVENLNDERPLRDHPLLDGG